jgi:ubiquinone/menaquinone biosynthesis C-methylase UbiE
MKGARDPYAKLADLYDLFSLDDAIKGFYLEWRKALLAAIGEFGIEVGTLVDIACGTGNTAIPWTGQPGWTVVGVDGSAAMLRCARRKSRRVRWHRQDLRELKLKDRADVVTCHFDALDHVLAPAQLQKVFNNVGRLLKPGGLFQFDMSTEAWFRWLAVREKMFPIGPHYMMATNLYDPSKRIATFHQRWFVKKGRLFEMRDIEVQERAYRPSEIRRMVRTAGFRLIRARVQREIEGKPVRMLYLARKA